MKKEIQNLIDKSQRGLLAAKQHLETSDYDFSVSRAYYAMFHITEALLLTKSLATSKHSGLISLFFEHFIKNGIFDKSLHQDLHNAFELRQQGDYWSDSEITKDMAKEVVMDAEKFVESLKNYLKTNHS